MPAVELILPGQLPERFAGRLQEHGLPLPLAQPEDGGPLFSAVYLHLIGSLLPPIEYLDRLQHRQVGSAELLRCAIYFTSDPDAYASCTLVEGRHYIFIGVDLVEQLVRCCEQLGPALTRRGDEHPDLDSLRAGPDLDAVLSNTESLDSDECVRLAEVARGWPIPGFGVGPDTPGIAEMTVLHDLLRLVVVHEFAHCVCGHVAFFSREMGARELPEFGAVRQDYALNEKLDAPRTHIRQAIEAHADEWSINFSALQVLVGYDPASLMFGERIDLVDRLLLLNIAFGIFAIDWTLSEQRINPAMSFRVGDTPAADDEGPDVIRSMGRPFRVVRSSHPPAVFRYYRHLYLVYGACIQHYGEQGLGTYVAARTTDFLATIAGPLSGYFNSLLNYTPSFAKTPDIKTLGAYEDYLHQLSVRMADFIDEFLPTIPEEGGS